MFKQDHQESEKTAYQMGDYICKLSYKGIVSSIRTLTTQNKKINQLKTGQGPEWLSVYRYTDIHV